MARYRDGQRRADQSPTQCTATKDGLGGVVDVAWAIREAGDERGGSTLHMEHTRGHPGFLVVGSNERSARSSTTQASLSVFALWGRPAGARGSAAARGCEPTHHPCALARCRVAYVTESSCGTSRAFLMTKRTVSFGH